MSNLGEVSSDTQIALPRSGLFSARPTSGMSSGDTYYATDIRRGYVTEDGVNWEDAPEVALEVRVSDLEAKLIELSTFLLEQSITIPDGII